MTLVCPECGRVDHQDRDPCIDCMVEMRGQRPGAEHVFIARIGRDEPGLIRQSVHPTRRSAEGWTEEHYEDTPWSWHGVMEYEVL